MKHQIISFSFIVLISMNCFAMENACMRNNQDELTPDQNKKIIEKYSASTWQKDLRYANAVLLEFYSPGDKFYKELLDDEWKEKYEEMIEMGFNTETIQSIKNEFFKRKCTVTKRVGNCYIGLVVTPSLIVLARSFGLF